MGCFPRGRKTRFGFYLETIDMLGGRVIGQGTYGCAVVPPLPCKKNTAKSRKNQKSETKVGKITLEQDAETELHISRLLRRDRLWKNYFILPDVVSCEPIPKNRQGNWQECGITSEYNSSQMQQLTSDFGGKSFALLTSSNLRPGPFSYFHFMRHTLEASAILTLRSIVHYDLHRSNILVDSLGVPRFLDFGMSFDAKEITEKILHERWKQYDPKYDQEPPEVTVITGIRKNMPLDAAVKDAILGKPVFRECELVLGVPKSQNIQELMAFFERSKSFAQKDWVAFFETYWPGLDSFALGAVLLHLLKTQVTWPSFVESPEWVEKGDTVYEVLRSMLHADPSARFDSVEALSVLFPDSVVLKNSEAWLAARKSQRQV